MYSFSLLTHRLSGRVLEVEQKELLERMRAQHKAVEDRAAEQKAKAKGA